MIFTAVNQTAALIPRVFRQRPNGQKFYFLISFFAIYQEIGGSTVPEHVKVPNSYFMIDAC